jgi:hypothetical protein
VVITQPVARVRVDHLCGPLASRTACGSTDCRSGRHSHGTAHGTDGSASQRATAGAQRGSNRMVMRRSALGGVGTFCDLFSGETPGNRSYGRANDRAHRASNGGAESGASHCATTGAYARAQRVRSGLAGDEVFVAGVGVTHGFPLRKM